jgi:hypothetical protein
MYMITGRHQKKAIVDQYVRNLYKALNIHRFTKRHIHIEFKTVLEDEADGLCLGDTKEVTVSIATKNKSFMRQMQALAHEMVHARQFLRGQLTCEGGFAWKGRKADGFRYKNQPWEKEAYKLERTLFLDCFPFDDLEV